MRSTRAALIFGYISFFFLTCIAFWYWKERIILCDAAYLLEELCRTKTYAIQVFRFGSFFTQTLPLLFIWCNLPLQYVAIAYSFSFVIIPFILFLLTASWLKEPEYAVGIPLYFLLMGSHVAYWIPSDLLQGMYWLFFQAALSEASSKGKIKFGWFIALNIPLMIMLAFMHPVLIFPTAFLFLYKRAFKAEELGLTLLNTLLFVIAFAVKHIFFKTSYEGSSLSGLQNFLHFWPDYFHVYANGQFLNAVLGGPYSMLTVAALLTLYRLLRLKKYRDITWMTAFGFAYLLLINVSFPGEDTPDFYREEKWMPLSFFVCLPLLKLSALRATRKPVDYTEIFLSVVLMVAFLRISDQSVEYTQRLHWTRNQIKLAAQTSSPKRIFTYKSTDIQPLMIHWGLSYEAWLLGEFEFGGAASLNIEENPGEYNWALPGKHAWIPRWGSFPYESLSPAYFHFQDTTEYVVSKPL